jgi:hypothetical protein
VQWLGRDWELSGDGLVVSPPLTEDLTGDPFAPWKMCGVSKAMLSVVRAAERYKTSHQTAVETVTWLNVGQLFQEHECARHAEEGSI